MKIRNGKYNNYGKNMREDLKLICSLATWRTLRKQEKTQYDVIAIFCENIIKKRYETVSFKTEELQNEIQNTYALEIPNSVLDEVILKKLHNISRNNEGQYQLNQKVKITTNMATLMEKYQEQYEHFSNDLLEFMKARIKDKESSQNILELFNKYLLYNNINKIKDKEVFPYFADFLLYHGQQYSELLQTIREGFILYEGLAYHIEKPKATQKLILFLDTEILFSAMGYNTSLYKKKFDEFYKLVCQYDEHRLLMPLRYNHIIKEEVRNFFYAAKEIKKNRNANYRPTAAMQYLMENFQNVNEIESEESHFFYKLKKDFKIEQYKDEYENLLNKHKEFNLENMQLIENIKKEMGENFNIKDEEELNRNIQMLNFINLVRQCYPKNFFEAKAFLISNTNSINALAWHNDIMETKSIPLSNKLDFMTARLWEFVETSLGTVKELESLNPIFNIQITLKEILYDDLNKQYDRAQQNFKENSDNDMFAQEILDIQEKMKLEPNIENIKNFEMIFSSDEVEEKRKLQAIEIEESYKEGMDFGREQGRKEAEREFRRKQKRDNYSKRLKAYKQKQCKKNVTNLPKILIIFVKKHKKILSVIFGIITFVSSLITIWLFFNAN